MRNRQFLFSCSSMNLSQINIYQLAVTIDNPKNIIDAINKCFGILMSTTQQDVGWVKRSATQHFPDS